MKKKEKFYSEKELEYMNFVQTPRYKDKILYVFFLCFLGLLVISVIVKHFSSPIDLEFLFLAIITLVVLFFVKKYHNYYYGKAEEIFYFLDSLEDNDQIIVFDRIGKFHLKFKNEIHKWSLHDRPVRPVPYLFMAKKDDTLHKDLPI